MNVGAVRPAVVVVTHFASPYQLELFDKIESLAPGWVKVYYLHRTHPTRAWPAGTPRHQASFLSEPGVIEDAASQFAKAPLAVFNYYAEPPLPALFGIRAATRKAWCFWGERPGYRHPRLGRLLRRWKLRHLHNSGQPIWGIGQWAVDAYRAEFGSNRNYVNLPYFSDLSRFASSGASPGSGEITFLYSGSISQRKGVDLLADAFIQLARNAPEVRLKIMGSGESESAIRGKLANLKERVEWVGFTPWEGLQSIYASAQFLCVPSRYDGWGLVVPEGLATGLPVIGTDKTGAAIDFIKSGINGWVARAGDTGSLLECLRTAAATKGEDWRRMSLGARESVSGHTLTHGAQRFIAAAHAALSH